MYSKLIKKAEEARNNAYAPYSKFAVGAALLTKNGKIYTGCNIENAAYSPTNCAERTAFFKAISDGERNFQAIAIVGGKEKQEDVFCPPCGVCRQVMLEFCDADFKVILKENNQQKVYSLSELIPVSFTDSML